MTAVETGEKISKIETQVESLIKTVDILGNNITTIKDSIVGLREVEMQIQSLVGRVQAVEEHVLKPGILSGFIKNPRDLLLSIAIGLGLSSVAIDWIRGNPADAQSKTETLATDLLKIWIQSGDLKNTLPQNSVPNSVPNDADVTITDTPRP